MPLIVNICAVFPLPPDIWASDMGAGAMIACPALCRMNAKNLFGEAKAGAIHCVPKSPVGRVNRHDRQRVRTFIAPLGGGILRASLCAGRRYYGASARGAAGYSRIGGEPRAGPAGPRIRCNLSQQICVPRKTADPHCLHLR